MATADDGYLGVYSEFCSHDTYDEVFRAALVKFRDELALGSVRSCLIYGPGEGRHEVWFVENCAPNTTRLIAVEPDRRSAERLTSRLERRLPAVESRVIETSIQSWKGPERPVDLVLMLHVLYYVDPGERRELFANLHERWLTDGGFAVVASSSRTKCPGNANEIYARLGTPMTAWEDIETDLLEAGFTRRHSHEMRYERDFSSADESFLRFYQNHIDRPVTLDDVRNAISELFPDGKSDQVFYTFAVFQKAGTA